MKIGERKRVDEMDATVENSTFTLTAKAVDKDIQQQHNVSREVNTAEKEQISRKVVLDIDIPPQLEKDVSMVSSAEKNHSAADGGKSVMKAATGGDKDPAESTSNLANTIILEKCESDDVQVHEEEEAEEQSKKEEEEKIVRENEEKTISDNCSAGDGQRVINNDSQQQTESENRGDSLKEKISEISDYIEIALDDLDDDDDGSRLRDKHQTSKMAIEVSSDHEMIHPHQQDPALAKVTRIRSGAWKSYAAILKKRSINWLNRSRSQMIRQRNIYGREIFKDLMKKKEERDIDSEENFNVQVAVEDEKEDEEEDDFNTENQAKRSKMDDDLLVESGVTEKGVCRRMEVEDSSRDNMFRDTTNEKDDNIGDVEKAASEVGKSTNNSTKIIDVDVSADDNKNSARIKKGKSHLQNIMSSKNQKEKSPSVHNTGRDDINLPPTKKLCLELEMNFACHDKILNEYIENSSNESVNDIQRHVEQLIVEIQTLNDMIRAKEMEWNNMIHLKKVKEEIVARLTRKRHVLSFSSAKFGSAALDFNAFAPDDLQKLADETKNMCESSMAKFTQAILLNRTNTSDDEQQKSVTNTSESRSVYQLKRSDGSSPASFSAINTAIGESGENHRASESGFSASQASAFASDLLNGHNVRLTQQMGRQGAIKDVKSIIADYRQRHPEIVPRRGRRMKSMLNENSCPKDSGNSRPSSADSSHSNFAPTSSSGQQSATQTGGATIGNLSFKDVLVQFAKLSQSDRQMISTATESSTVTAISQSLGKPPPPYPEVTLYPVSSQSNDQQQIVLNSTNNNTHSNSLLHGILTKSTTRPNAAGFTSFSPTLARLLTAPERITTTPQQNASGQFQQQINPALNLSKSHSEITITPVVSQTNYNQQSFLQQQQQHQRFDNGNSSAMPSVQIRMKQENIFNIDDEADDSADRLVIDEGSDKNMIESGSTKEQQISMVGQEFHENEVPECQGCKKREAQFVCAGCGNQWYCSRECQVSAWDEHSEVCTG